MLQQIKTNKRFKIALMSVAVLSSIGFANQIDNMSGHSSIAYADMYSSEPTMSENEAFLDKYAGTEQNVTVTITTQADLDAYLAKTGHDLTGDFISFKNNENIIWPKGTYIVSGGIGSSATMRYTNIAIYGDTKGDIDFGDSELLIDSMAMVYGRVAGDQNNKTIKNLTVYGTGTSQPNRGGIYWAFLHAKNMTFTNMTYKNAQAMDTHIYDIMGSDNINITNHSIQGSPITMTLIETGDVSTMYKNYPHRVYSESIQVDTATAGASGNVNITNGSDKNADVWWNETYDDKPSSNINITDSEFTAYKGQSGDAKIRGMSNTYNYSAGSTIGAHSASSTGVGFTVNMENLTFSDTLYVSGVKDKVLAPIHFLTTTYETNGLPSSTDSEKETRYQAIEKDGVRLSTQLLVKNITVNRPLTPDAKPTYWDESGATVRTSAWTAWYQSTELGGLNVDLSKYQNNADTTTTQTSDSTSSNDTTATEPTANADDYFNSQSTDATTSDSSTNTNASTDSTSKESLAKTGISLGFSSIISGLLGVLGLTIVNYNNIKQRLFK